MSKNVNVTIRMDKEVKDQFDTLLDDLGIGFSTAVNIFIRKCLREGGIPFSISIGDVSCSVFLDFVKLYINSGAASREELVALRNILDTSIVNDYGNGFTIKKRKLTY